MYTKIIVPFDGSEFSSRAIPVAHQLAIATDAPLKIVAFGITASHVDRLYDIVGAEAEVDESRSGALGEGVACHRPIVPPAT